MARGKTVEERLTELTRLPLGADEELRKALGDKNNLISARAAKLIGDQNLDALQAELTTAFQRWMIDGGKADKGCAAKTEIAKTLHAMESRDEKIFLAGIQHVQHEPVWGGQSDVAGELRGICAMALVQMGYRGAMNHVVPLLVDPIAEARIAAVRAVASWAREESEPILRLKALTGDEKPEVTAECLTGLMLNWGATSAEFVANFLDDEELKESAAVALAESKRPEAFAALKMAYEASLEEGSRKMLLTAIALSRQESAIEYLLALIAEDHARTAALAVAAMKLYRGDERVKQRIKSIAADRDEMILTEAVKETFGE